MRTTQSRSRAEARATNKWHRLQSVFRTREMLMLSCRLKE